MQQRFTDKIKELLMVGIGKLSSPGALPSSKLFTTSASSFI